MILREQGREPPSSSHQEAFILTTPTPVWVTAVYTEEKLQRS